MRSNLLKLCAVIFLLLIMIIPLTGAAASYTPSFLFHSGDVFVVYRINPLCKMEEVGRVRFVKFVGELYLEAEVIEVELKAGDIAKEKNISCLVVATEPCTR